MPTHTLTFHDTHYPSHLCLSLFCVSPGGRTTKVKLIIIPASEKTIQRQFAAAAGNPSIVLNVGGLGCKDRPTFSKMFRNGTFFQQILFSVEKELRPKLPGTPVGTKRNSISARSRIFLQSNEFIKFGAINGSTDFVRSFLNIPQEIFVLVMPRALDAGLKNGPPILAKPSS